MPSRRLLLLSVALLTACPTPAPPPTTVVPDCTHVDGRGSPAADGSAAHPFASIDEAAAALGPMGGTICLPPGEMPPPTHALTAPLVLRGSTAGETALTGNVGGCLAVTEIPVIPPDGTLQNSDAVIETSADLTLEAVTLSACAIGIRARGGDIILNDVTIETVQAGVVVEAEASLTTTMTSITLVTSATGPTVPPGGVVSVATRGITLGDGTDLSGRGAGIYLWNVGAEVSSVHIHDMPAGIVVGGNEADRMVHVESSMIEHLVTTDFGGGFNVVSGGQLVLDHVTIRDASTFALATDGTQATIMDSSFAGTGQLLRVQGGSADLMGACTFTGGTVGVAAVEAVLTTSAPANVRVMGTIASSGATVVHAFADNGATLALMAAGSTFDGGPLGLGAYSGSHVMVTSGLTITNVGTGVGIFDAGTIAEVVDMIVSPRDYGVLTSEGSSRIESAMIMGGQHPVVVRDGALTMIGGMVQGGTSSGVRMVDGMATLNGVTIDATGGPGVSVEGGMLEVDGVHVTNGGDIGLVVHDGATVTIANSTFDANVGAAIALYGGDVHVGGSTFMPSQPEASGRADAIRVTAIDGMPATMTLDPTPNSFQLSALACAPDTCSVILSSGVGANAIVRPNCITTGANVMEGVAQDSGLITGDTSMLTVRTSAGVLLAPGSFPGLPGVLPNPPVPMGVLSSIAF